MTPRSWLYCPGNVPGKIVNVHSYGADGVILDLEDSVASSRKEEARFLVAAALSDFFPSIGGPAELPVIGVRINALTTPWWRDDLSITIASGAELVRVPKVESAAEVELLCTVLESYEIEENRPVGSVRLQCILETPVGVEEAFAIATVSPRLESLSFGAEDYCAATGIDRSGPEWVLDYPRSRIVAAAASCGLAAYDTVWSGFGDIEGVSRDALRARDLGMDGKSAIHPSQITEINRIFTPTPKEIAWAERVVEAASDGAASAVDGSMVDAPVLKRARRFLARRSV